MFEKRWAAVSPQLFTSNGTANGQLTVLDSSVFKVKQQVNISANAQPNLNLEIKSILDDVTILVGPPAANIFTYSDISAYTVAGGANIWAIEQKRSSVPVEEINRAVYEEEPVVATRTILVDKHGDKYDSNNPLPVDATISVVVPPVSVALDALTPPNQPDPDNVLIAGSEDGTKGGLKHAVVVDSELKLRVKDVDAIAELANISTVLGNPLEVTGPLTDAELRASPVPVSDADTHTALANIIAAIGATGNNLTIGTENGQVGGTQHVFVNNLRLMILASSDVVSSLTYADFGTKNQRITRIDYTSATFPSVTVRRDFNYVPDGTRYRRTTMPWSIV